METLINTEKLERLTQKEITRFFMRIIEEQKSNPSKFDGCLEITKVSINDDGLMTKVLINLNQIHPKASDKRNWLYTDNHAQDYSCSNMSLSPIK